MSATEAEERAQFTLGACKWRINDLDLLRALERTVARRFSCRRDFADISGRDIAPADRLCRTPPPPSVLASMIAALEVGPTDRVCEIGTGSGLLHGSLAQLAGEVLTAGA